MPRFIVKTIETVEGTYAVEADTPEQAHAQLADLRSLHAAMDDGSAEQLDYLAFEVDVREVAPAPGSITPDLPN